MWNASGWKIADRLGQPLPPVSAPPRLRERVLDAVKPQPGIVLNQAGLLIARSAGLPWHETPIAGLYLVMASQKDEILG